MKSYLPRPEISNELNSAGITIRKEEFYILAYALTTCVNFSLTSYEGIKKVSNSNYLVYPMDS
jgi:hypothetical protein